MQIKLTGIHKEYVEISSNGMNLEFTDKEAKRKLCDAIAGCFQDRKALVDFIVSEFEIKKEEL